MTSRASLAERIGSARAARFVDLAVPGVEGVYVRYKALSAAALEGAAKRAGKRSDVPAVLSASVDVLVDACVGVWEQTDPDKGASVSDAFGGVLERDERGGWKLSGDLPTFSAPELAEVLGVEPGRAATTVLGLYVTEGDVIGTADAVVMHSNANGEELLSEARAF